MKELSIKELIDTARGCAGDMVGNACVGCAFHASEGDCASELLLALADKLEKLGGEVQQSHQAFTDADPLQERSFGNEYRLTARENGHAYFMQCFEEPCLGRGCKYENCAFIRAVCEKLCRYEEGSACYGVEWIDVKCALPAADDEYLVMVAGAKKPTVLYFDVEHNGFYQEDCDGEGIWHCVTHWAEIPSLSIKADEVVSSEQASRRRCATCAYEDRMAESDRCIECEKHSLWEEKI